MTRTMIETDAMAATTSCEGGSSPTGPENARGPGKLALKHCADELARQAQVLRRVPEDNAEADSGIDMPWTVIRHHLMLLEDALALLHDLADQIERITPYLDETAQGDDDDLQPGGTA